MTTPTILYNCRQYLVEAAKNGNLPQARQEVADFLRKEGIPLEWMKDAPTVKPFERPAIPYAKPPTKKR